MQDESRRPRPMLATLLACACLATAASCARAPDASRAAARPADARPTDARPTDVRATGVRSTGVATDARAGAAPTGTPTDAPPTGAYGPGQDTWDGIGQTYFGREIARFMSHQAIGWLERGTREAEERTSLLLEALDLRPGMIVADIGAGSGHFSLPMARRVAPGRVLATDIQPEMIDFLQARARTEGVDNVDGILGKTDDAALPESGVDLVLLVDAYHEFDRPWEMARSIHRALRPGGRVALVEYRAEDPDVPIKPLHRMSVEQARLEWEAAGFRWIATDERLPIQHLIWFAK